MSLGLQILPIVVRRPEDIEAAFARMAQDRAGALAPVPGTMFRVIARALGTWQHPSDSRRSSPRWTTSPPEA